MFKKMGFAFIGLTALASASAFAFPTPAEMEANYNACESENYNNWMGRWGQYVVAFDIYKAQQVCSAGFPAGIPQLTPCKLNGKWVYTGYYCREIDGGGNE